MSGKNQVPIVLNFQATDPRIGFLPLNGATANKGSLPSGIAAGAMAATNTIWSNIVDISRMDNVGIELAWAGTAVGVVSVLVSVSGINFNALSFSPAIGQPAGTTAGEFINLTQLAAKYILLQYANASGAGALTAWLQLKDLN
jgi:hypothetical protein